MAHRLVFSYSGTLTADTQVELDPVDLSNADEIHLETILTGAAGQTSSDKLNVRLQSRTQANRWCDRVALAHFDGGMSAGELKEATLQKFGTFSDSEETDEPSGSSGGSRLTAGSVRNGPFPGRYRNPGVGTESAWRVDLDLTFVGAASFPITVNVYTDSAI